MNYQDVALLNGSLDNLGSTLMRNRVLEAQERERVGQQQSRQAQIGLEQARVNAEEQRGKAAEAHYQQIEQQNAATAQARLQQGDAATQAKAKDSLFKTWTNQTQAFAKNIQQGAMTPQQANAALNAAWQHMPTASKSLLADHPVAAVLDEGQPFFDESGNPAKDILPKGAEVSLPDGRTVPVVYNPQTGSFNVQEAPKTGVDPVALQKMKFNDLYERRKQTHGAWLRASGAKDKAALQQQLSDIDSQIQGVGAGTAPATTTAGSSNSTKMVFDPGTGKLVPAQP